MRKKLHNAFKIKILKDYYKIVVPVGPGVQTGTSDNLTGRTEANTRTVWTRLYQENTRLVKRQTDVSAFEMVLKMANAFVVICVLANKSHI